MAENIDPDHPGDFNQAVMEFGALQCTPKNPDCANCLFNESCYALRKNMVAQLPVRETKKKPRERYFSYFVIRDIDDSIVLKKRIRR